MSIHSDFVDAMITAGYDIDEGGACAGLTMKWLEAVDLGPEEEKKFKDRLNFICGLHHKWNLYRKRSTDNFIPEGNAIVISGDPDIKNLTIYQNKKTKKNYDLSQSKVFSKLNKDLINSINLSNDGLIDLPNQRKDLKKLIRKLLRENALPYSKLIDEIERLRFEITINPDKISEYEKDEYSKKLLEAPAFFDNVFLFQDPSKSTQLFNTKDPVEQFEINKIMYYAGSQMSESMEKSLEKIYSMPRHFNLEMLEKYIAELENLTPLENNLLKISLDSKKHRIGLKYDANKKIWTLFDSNFLPRYIDLSGNELAKWIMQNSFKESNVTSFSFDVYARRGFLHKDQLKTKLSELDDKYPLITDESSQWQTKHDEDIFFTAARNHQNYVLEKFSKYINLQQKNKDGHTVLEVAAICGNVEFIQIIMRLKPNEINLNQRVEDNLTMLHVAAIKDYKILTDFLLKNGVDPNLRDDSDNTPMHFALTLKNYDLAHQLLEKMSVDDLFKQNMDGISIFQLAIDKNAKSIFVMILKKVGNSILNVIDEENNSLLQKAVEESNWEIAQIILDNMDTHLLGNQNKYGKTILHSILKNLDDEDYVPSQGKDDFVENLVNKMNSDDMRKRDKYGDTPLEKAIEYHDNHTAQLIIEKLNKSDLLAKNEYGDTVLHLAIEKKRVKILELLLKKISPEDLKIENDIEESPLDLARNLEKGKTYDLIQNYWKAHKKNQKSSAAFSNEGKYSPVTFQSVSSESKSANEKNASESKSENKGGDIQMKNQ